MARKSLILALVLGPVVCSAAHYDVLPRPATSDARVTVTLDNGQTSTAFHMCAWLPGDYETFHYGKIISDVEFTRGGKRVDSEHEADNPDLWTVTGGADTVAYTVKGSFGNFSPNLRVRDDEVFINGGGVFGWFDGHQKEEQSLTVQNVYGEKAVAETPMSKKGDGWVAKDFDRLLDSPFVLGRNTRTAQVKVGDRTLIAVGYGRASQVPADMSGFARVGGMAAEQTLKIVGDLPWKTYRFFFDFGGGGGGLEHLEAARIGAWGGSPEQMAGIIFHEFFHCVNVKTVRASVLGPFDYTRPARTSTLWWLEGVTDYYASVMRMRAGLQTPAATVDSLFRSTARLNRSGPASKATASEASLKVWDNRGSDGYAGLSYYSKGLSVGQALDWAIRAESKGKHSLDDVVRELYKECHGGPGYRDSRIRELVAQFGGPKLGPLYDAWVDGLGPVGYALEAAAFGVTEEGKVNPDQTPSERAMFDSWAKGVPYAG